MPSIVTRRIISHRNVTKNNETPLRIGGGVGDTCKFSHRHLDIVSYTPLFLAVCRNCNIIFYGNDEAEKNDRLIRIKFTSTASIYRGEN